MMFLTEFISDVYANMKEEDSIMSKTKGKKSNYKLISQFITLLSSMKKIMS